MSSSFFVTTGFQCPNPHGVNVLPALAISTRFSTVSADFRRRATERGHESSSCDTDSHWTPASRLIEGRPPEAVLKPEPACNHPRVTRAGAAKHVAGGAMPELYPYA